ncbi:hypothetical protein B9Z55_007031 [Caenorhabditis nigoni]|uniref:Peptidase A2 domain-containing protein n=1 Tax=Caenorhabditis nigoni TaxID=1611254 RepID=A0A2G5V7V9_9PELO|nr:hypothetical protein B9Z55_007031 [Caenorhabditis nigoni]
MMRISYPWFLSPFTSNALCLPDEQRTSKSILYRCKTRGGVQRREPKLRGTKGEEGENGKVELINHEVTRKKEDIKAKSCKQIEQLIKETKYPGIERRERDSAQDHPLGSSFATIFPKLPRPNPSSESPREVPGLCCQASKPPRSLQAVSRSCTPPQQPRTPSNTGEETLQRKEDTVAKLKSLFGRRRGTRTSPVRTRSRSRREAANPPRTSSPIPGRTPPRLQEPESSDEEETTIIRRNQTFTPNQTLQMNREALEDEIEELARTMQARETQLAALNQTIIRQPTPRNEVVTTPRNKPTSQIPTWKQKADLAKTLDPRIKKFSEGRSSDLFRWLEEYSKTLFRLEIPRKIGTEMLPFFLSGTALIKYNSIDEAITHDWEKVTQQLMKLHDCPADRELSRQELTSTKQGKRSVTAFADHIRKQGEYCYQGIAPQVRDGLLVSHFINGCSKEIKTRLRQLQKQPKDLAETIAEAEKIQRLIQLEEEEDDTIDGLEAQINQLRFQQTQGGQPTRGRGEHFSGGNYPNESNGENCQNPRGGQHPGWFQNDNRQGRGKSNGRNGPQSFGNHGNSFQDSDNHSNGNSNQNSQRIGNDNNQNQNQSSNQPQRQGPRIGWDGNGRPYLINNISKVLLGLAMCLMMITNVSATQICGFGETGNVFIPPTPTLCNFDHTLPLKAYSVNVYQQKSEATTIEAHKCFKHEIRGETYSFLRIYTSTEAKMGYRVAISSEECRRTAITKKYKDAELEEIAPGIYRSHELKEAAENSTSWIGTTTFKTFEFTLEVGKVASLDGEHVISTLGSLEKCTFSSGSCQDESSTVVWEPKDMYRECQFELVQKAEAIISQQHVAVPEMEIFSKFDTDLRRLQNALDGCSIHQGYRTDDGYIIEFPDVQGKGWVPDMHIDPSMTGKLPEYWFRRTRDTVTMLGPAGTTFSVDIGEPFFTPIVRRLFAATNIDQLTELKNPITEPEILKEFGRYNVTNKLLSDRAQLYPEDRKHPNGRLLIALKAIRVAQYGYRQLKRIRDLKRPLTRAEQELMIGIERKTPFLFDSLLEKEFGRSDSTTRNRDPQYENPRFDEEKLETYRNLLPMDEPSWTTTTTEPPTTKTPEYQSTLPPYQNPRQQFHTTTTTKAPEYQSTLPPYQNSSQQLHTTTTTRSPSPTQPSPRSEMGHVPEANRNVVHEATAAPRKMEAKEQDWTEKEEQTQFNTFKEVCLNQWRETSLFQTILKIDPTAAIRQLLRRTDVSAKIIGESLLVSKCRQVTPDVVHYGRKVNNTCYNLTPVTVKGKLWFQLPGSEDLIGEASEIACEDRPPIIRFEHNRWVGLGNQEVQPQFLARPNGRPQEQFLLPAPETFHTNLEEETGVSTGTDKEMQNKYGQHNRNLRKRLITEGILTDTIGKVKETTESAGKSVKNLYKSAMDSLKDGVKEVVFSMIALILWICVPIVTILLIVFSIYGYCKYKAYKGATSVAKRASRKATREMFQIARNALINNVNMQETTNFGPVSRTYQEEYPIYAINSIQINTVPAVKLPHINVEVDGMLLEALLDTGAEISYLPLSSVTSTIDTKDRPQARTANGTSISFLGTWKSAVKIGKHLVSHTFLVSQDGDCPAPMLIGADVVKKLNTLGHELSLNLHKNIVKIGNCHINVSPISEPKQESTKVQMTQNSQGKARAVHAVCHPTMEKEFQINDNNKRIRVLHKNNCKLAISEAPPEKPTLENEAAEKSSN